ncbi:MAG TPA: apolipoprotein N-acyltransferase [Methylomirabilota bacterium]|jgi:apolipoprotein N-acyltransferase|nr:apolipoprotein N-acyltransferase [Methylomirabilota bacterium]
MSRPADLAAHAAVLLPAAFVTALAFPRTDWSLTPWLGLAPLLAVATIRAPRTAFLWGWASGTLFFLVLLRWLQFTFQVYSAIPWPVVYGPVVLLAAYCGFWTGAVAWAVSWLTARRSAALALALAPFFWVAGEWLRGHLMGGFPWGTLGYSQYLQLRVIQIAELAGVHGVSFVLLAVNAAIAGCVVLRRARALAGLGAAAVLVAATLGFGTLRLHEPAPPAIGRVSIIQPSIEQPLKWEPRHTQETLGIYFALLRLVARERPDLVVWPETAAPTILRRDPALVERFRAAAAELKAPMLLGSVDAAGNPPRFRNTVFLITDRGIVGRYDKIHLVPFGEFVPLSGVLGFVRGWAEFIAELEAGSRAVVFKTPPAPVGVVICYEGIFPDLFREFVRDGAQLMVNMTNDAWFGRTSGPEQHLTMYPFRAIEHRVTIVRAANTGVSAFIAPSGIIVRRLHLFERGVLTESVLPRTRHTLFTRLGDWIGLLSLAVTTAAVAAAWRRPAAAATGSA